MFTGLIEKQGQVLGNIDNGCSNRLIISASLDHVQAGESISVNGVCLTLLPETSDELHFDVSPETLKVTNLAHLVAGDCVNLERAMYASTRFGGHYVSAHVDTIAQVHSILPIGEYLELELSGFSMHSMLYLIPKGSITVDGVSLTINSVINQNIKLMLVPHTLLHTSLRFLVLGQKVNIEFDYLTRIVAHQLHVFGKLNSETSL